MVIQGWYCNGHDKCCSITLDQSCPLPPPKTDPSPSLLPFQAFVTFASAQLFNAIILNSAPSKLCHLHKMDFFNTNTKGHPIFISHDFFIQAIYGFQLEILIVQSIFEQWQNCLVFGFKIVYIFFKLQTRYKYLIKLPGMS